MFLGPSPGSKLGRSAGLGMSSLAFFLAASAASLLFRTIGLTWVSTHLKPSGSFELALGEQGPGGFGVLGDDLLQEVDGQLAGGGGLVAEVDLRRRERAARRSMSGLVNLGASFFILAQAQLYS